MTYYDVDKNPYPSTQQAPEPGYGSVSEYMASSLPWLTASTATTATTIHYELPKVAKFVHLINHGSASQFIRFGFSQNGVEKANYVKVDGGKELKLDVRVKDVFIRSDDLSSPTFSFAAGLTMIPARFAPTLTGSLTSSAGTWTGVG